MAGEGGITRRAPVPRRVPAQPHTVGLVEEERIQPDGTIHHGILVSAEFPTALHGVYQFSIWVRHVGGAAEDWNEIVTTKHLPILIRDPRFAADTSWRVAVLGVSAEGRSVEPEGGVNAEITLDGKGRQPPDVSGFGAKIHHGSVLFDWTPLSAGWTDVLGYEIRSGTTGWLSATHVIKVATANRRHTPVPRPVCPGSTFYIKALTRTEYYSENEGTTTLTAAEAAGVDAHSPVDPQEVTVTAGSKTVTVTTVAPYDSTPFLTGSSSSAAGQLPRFHSFVQNGDLTWSCTMKISDAAATGGETFHVHAAGPYTA